MLSSQFLGKTTIKGLLEGEDVIRTADALRAMGVPIAINGSGEWIVNGVGVGGLNESADVMDMGNSGTSTRLLMGLVTPYPFTSFFTGDASLRKRPMRRVIQPLEMFGARVITRGEGRLPLALQGTADPVCIAYTLPVASAQVKSAIILAAMNTRGTTSVIEKEATRDHTERMLRYFGWKITSEKTAEGILIRTHGQQRLDQQDRTLTVSSDPSSAAFLIVAALITPDSDITLPNVCMNPLRTGLFTTLKEMGASLNFLNEREVAGEPVADIQVKYSTLKGVDIPAHRAPSMIDEYPILSIAAAFAKGKTHMRGLSELRVKESDRLSAIAAGLAACGVACEVAGDDLIVSGAETVKGGAKITTHMDHRIAMSFLVMGMASRESVSVDDTGAISTSFPNFIGLCNALGASIKDARKKKIASRALPKKLPKVIAIDGPAASGKGTLARRLAEFLGYAHLDTGSLYRAVGLKLVYSDQDPMNKDAAIKAAQMIDEEDLANPRLRQESVGRAASIISSYPEVRQILLDYQRQFAREHKGAILDGRDIGTVVCPDADLKIFMTASLEARADRRHRELEGEGIEVVFDSVLDNLRERDERDSKRAAAPLVPAKDAIVMDTSDLDANTTFERVLDVLEGFTG
jgi:3-phosphoshikimate 1-carboxyvinyltransferase